MGKYQTQRRVEFRDTDAAGIMHFSVYFTLMEQVEHEFLRHIGLSVHQETDGRTISWPRVSAHCDYIRPVAFEELLDVQLSIKRLGEKSITYAFDISLDGSPVAKGSLSVVCCLIQTASLQSIAVPQEIVDKITPFVETAGDNL